MNILREIPLGRFVGCSTKAGVCFSGFLQAIGTDTVTLRPADTLEGHGWIVAKLDDLSTVELWPEDRVHIAFQWLKPKQEQT